MRNKTFAALLSVALLSMGWLRVSGLPLLVALVPLLWISAQYGSSRRDFWRMWGWAALVFGLWNLVTVWWIWNATWIGTAAAVAIGAVWTAGAFMVFHFVSKRAPKWLSYTVLVSVWLSAEWLLTVGQISFPWLVLGNGLAWDIPLVQWYDTTGVFGGSLWALLCNVLFFEAWTARTRLKTVAAGALLLLPPAASLVKYYTYRAPAETTTVTVVQPDIDPYEEKFSIPVSEQAVLLMDLIREAPADAEWIVTPETALAQPMREGMLDTDPVLGEFRGLMRADYPGAQLILGASTTRYYFGGPETWTARPGSGGASLLWYDHYNTVLGVDSTPTLQIRHKSVLLVGVEMTPWFRQLRDWLVIDMGGVSGQLGVDPEPVVFTSPEGHKAGAAVCWEGVFGGYMGGFVTRGAQILLIISNDGWWGDTPGHRQLFALAQLRAVELRRSVARSANTGTSGLITPRGDAISSLGWDKRGVLTGELPLNDKVTFYARHGDYIARIAGWVFWASLLGFVIYRLRRKR